MGDVTEAAPIGTTAVDPIPEGLLQRCVTDFNGDGYCDTACNLPVYDWDGGDCCLETCSCTGSDCVDTVCEPDSFNCKGVRNIH